MRIMSRTIALLEAFLSDYSGLKAAPDNPSDELYIAPDTLTKISQSKAVMVDQPELFLHPESKYTDMKIKGEVLDSPSLDQLAAYTMSRGSLGGQSEGEATSWDELTQCETIVYSPPAQ